MQAWEARSAQGLLGHVLTDAVTGKHELIDYAVALSLQGQLPAVDIMEYRETRGVQIRRTSRTVCVGWWRHLRWR